jgi:hypothetical protein
MTGAEQIPFTRAVGNHPTAVELAGLLPARAAENV